MKTRFANIGMLIMTLVMLGCGESVPTPPKEDLVAVSGIVKFDGKPVEGVAVSFVPAGSTTGQGASAVTDDQGKYVLVHNATQKPGVAVGDYTVQLTKWVLPDGSPLPKDKAPHLVGAVNMIPERWSESGPGNNVKVPAGGTTRDFDIPKP